MRLIQGQFASLESSSRVDFDNADLASLQSKLTSAYLPVSSNMNDVGSNTGYDFGTADGINSSATASMMETELERFRLQSQKELNIKEKSNILSDNEF